MRRTELRETQEAERLATLEYHQKHSGEYLYRIYRWVRFGGVVLVLSLLVDACYALAPA